MTTKEIKPKTLAAVLSAEIKENADEIAKYIVDKAKNGNVEYAELVEEFILGKTRSKNTSFSSFCKNAFEEIKDTEKLLSFEVDLSTSWKLDEKTKTFSRYQDNIFSIRARIDEGNDKPSWDQTLHSVGNNLHTTFDIFKIELKDRIANIPTEIEIDEDKDTVQS